MALHAGIAQLYTCSATTSMRYPLLIAVAYTSVQQTGSCHAAKAAGLRVPVMKYCMRGAERKFAGTVQGSVISSPTEDISAYVFCASSSVAWVPRT